MIRCDAIRLRRTAGRLRHLYITSHHLCRECEASGEQLPFRVFLAEIDIRAHRLQQHPSGLSRAQQAAERTIFPAELNFNFAASSTANASASSGAASRRAVQSCNWVVGTFVAYTIQYSLIDWSNSDFLFHIIRFLSCFVHKTAFVSLSATLRKNITIWQLF